MTRKVVGAEQKRLRNFVARWLSTVGLAAILMAAVLRPADSIEVEQGAALYLLPIAIFTWLASVFVDQPGSLSDSPGGKVSTWTSRFSVDNSDLWFGVLVFGFLVWLGIATASVVGVGNVRQAVNEWWWWVTGAFVLAAARRCCAGMQVARMVIFLFLGLAVGLCAFAAHQQWVSLPADRVRYEAEPERVLELAGISAPPGSPQRMLFESRLFGGGVTATFALANSLAGLMVLAFPLAVGLMVSHGQGSKSRWTRMVGIGIATLVLVVLVWTDSRSAYLSLMVGIIVGVIRWWLVDRKVVSDQGEPRFLRWGRWLYVGLFGGGVIWTIGLALSPGLWSLAPRSLAFRFQYWQATLKMLVEHPWFGAGPGNYQQRYGLYRLDEASETISDPHHWLMEIFGAGGVVAGVLFLALATVAILKLWSSSNAAESAASAGLGVMSRGMAAWGVGLGSVIGFLGVVVYWVVEFQPFDFDALMLFVVFGGACYLLLAWLSGHAAASRAAASRAAVGSEFWWEAKGMRSWGLAAFTSLGIHLFASGGLTVPGIAVPALVLVATLIPYRGPGEAEMSGEGGWGRWLFARQMWFKFGGALGLLAVWQLSAWSPTRASERFSESAGELIAVGQVERGLELFAEAVAADAWDPEVAAKQSEVLLWTSLSAGSVAEASENLERWQGAIDEAVERDPGAGQLRALRARQNLILYQRYGDRDALQRAREALRQAIELGPTEEAWVMQLAAVSWKLGERKEAERLKERAKILSLAGGHADRGLDVVSVLVVDFLGTRVLREGPFSVTAERLFVDWRTR